MSKNINIFMNVDEKLSEKLLESTDDIANVTYRAEKDVYIPNIHRKAVHRLGEIYGNNNKAIWFEIGVPIGTKSDGRVLYANIMTTQSNLNGPDDNGFYKIGPFNANDKLCFKMNYNTDDGRSVIYDGNNGNPLTDEQVSKMNCDIIVSPEGHRDEYNHHNQLDGLVSDIVSMNNGFNKHRNQQYSLSHQKDDASPPRTQSTFIDISDGDCGKSDVIQQNISDELKYY